MLRGKTNNQRMHDHGGDRDRDRMHVQDYYKESCSRRWRCEIQIARHQERDCEKNTMPWSIAVGMMITVQVAMDSTTGQSDKKNTGNGK